MNCDCCTFFSCVKIRFFLSCQNTNEKYMRIAKNFPVTVSHNVLDNVVCLERKFMTEVMLIDGSNVKRTEKATINNMVLFALLPPVSA